MAKRFFPQGPNIVRKLEEQVFDGYAYVFQRERLGTTFLMCKDRHTEQCRGAGKLVNDTFFETTGHCHAPVDELHEVSRFFSELYRSTTTEMKSITDIFDNVGALHPEAAALVDRTSVLSRMARWRLTIVLPVPRSYDHLREMLYSVEWRVLRLHSRGHVDVTVARDDDNLAVGAVFFDRNLLRKLSLADCRELHVCSSTRLLPANTDTREMVIIIAIHRNHAIPCVWGFLSSPEPVAYAAVFEPLDGLIRPDTIYGNFEKSLHSEATRVYPLVDVKSSFFYFSLILFGVAKDLGLDIRVDAHLKTVFKNVMALALLPAERIQQGFDIIRNAQPPEYAARLVAFFQHVQEVWLDTVTPERFTVNRDHRGITDPAITSVKILEYGVGIGRNMSTILSRGILRVSSQSQSNLARLNNRAAVTTTPRVRSLVSLTILNRVWKMSVADATDLSRFFDQCSKLLQPFFANMIFRDESPVANLQPIGNDENEENFELLFPALDRHDGDVADANENAAAGNENAAAGNADLTIGIDQKCVVCLTNGIRYICLPCLHVAFCEQCAHTCMAIARENGHSLRCPLCRQIATHFSPAYFPG